MRVQSRDERIGLGALEIIDDARESYIHAANRERDGVGREPVRGFRIDAERRQPDRRQGPVRLPDHAIARGQRRGGAAVLARRRSGDCQQVGKRRGMGGRRPVGAPFEESRQDEDELHEMRRKSGAAR